MIGRKEVLTRSDSGVPEYHIYKSIDQETSQQRIELLKHFIGIMLVKAGAKCVGDCGKDCELDVLSKRNISDYSEIEPLMSRDGAVVEKQFKVKTLAACDKLNTEGVLDCRDPRKPIIQPKPELIHKVKPVNDYQASIIDAHNLA